MWLVYIIFNQNGWHIIGEGLVCGIRKLSWGVSKEPAEVVSGSKVLKKLTNTALLNQDTNQRLLL
jgi:hypothetical protein